MSRLHDLRKDFEQCKRIARVLDTSMDYLAGLTDVKEPYPRTAKK